MPDLPIGSTFADHEILGVAGRGGMGVVYRARHLRLQREVALKVIASELSADPTFRARFRRECEAAAAIQHAHVVPVYHAGEEHGRLYVTMRFVEGTDLSHVLPVQPARAVTLISQVAEALDAAHRVGLVHRDVKPANVLIEGSGSALLTDFGVSKDVRAQSQHTEVGGFVGTFDYAAPEQFTDAGADPRADVYALGCVLFELLTGRVPFPADTLAAKMFAHVQQPPPAAPGVAPALSSVIRRAMAKAPADRFASAGALAAAARAALQAGSEPLAPPRGLVGESSDGPFVGRAEELERLRARLAAALGGERQFVVLTGEAGIGKSRLAIEVARMAYAGGASILYGRSNPDSLVPYQPFITALKLPLALPEELRPDLNELGRFIPALRTGEPFDGDPETRRLRLFEAVTRVLAALAREHPVVLVLDDLHWADASTLALLAYVLSHPEPVRMLVLATAREDVLARHRSERIALTGLDPTAAAELGASAALHEQTAGNPFFIEELLRANESDGVPESVKAMIERRLARLSPATNQVLALASVAGREFGVEVLESLLDADVLSALEEAEAAGLVREVDVDRFLFAHALVRETLYESQSASRRVRAHFAIAEALAASAHPAEVAHHYFASAHLDRTGRAIEFSARAGEEAAAALAYDEAVRHFRNALGEGENRAAAARGESRAAAGRGEGPAAGGDSRAAAARGATAAGGPAAPGGASRVALLLALGEAEARAGDEAARATFARAAELATTPEDLGRAALGFAGRHATSGLVDREAIALLEKALAALEGTDSALVAILLARLANSLHFAAARGRPAALSAQALEVARAVGDPRALALALESRQSARLHPDHLEERLELGQEILALARRLGDRELEALGSHLRVRDLMEAGETAVAREHHAALHGLAEQLRQPLYGHFDACWDALFAYADLDPDAAEEHSRRAFALGKQAQVRPAVVIFASQHLARGFRMGVTPEIVGRLEGALEQGPGLPVWRAMLALGYARTGRADEAREQLARVSADRFATIPRDMLWMSTVCLAAETASDLEDTALAETLYAILEPFKERQVQAGSATANGSTERFLGLLAHTRGDLPRAAEHLSNAVAKNAAWGMRHALPLVQVDFATTLKALGEHERAAEQAAAAIPDAERLRMAPTVQKATGFLLDP